MTKKIVQKIILAGIVVHDGKVLIVQRSSDEAVFPELWEIPSGKREHFETSFETVKREVKEEVGFEIEPIMPVHVFEFRVEKEDEIRDSTQISYLAKPAGEPNVKLSDEHQDYVWVTRNDIDKYDLGNVKTAILKAFELLESLDI